MITLMVYRTTVVNGIATASVPYSLTVNDVNGDGIINRDEWVATTGDVPGQIGGTTTGMPALWDGTTGATNLHANGFLYTSGPISTTAPGNLVDTQAILAAVTHAPKYEIAISDLMICFVAGTLIETPAGLRPVESLQPGDMVLTRDHGPQPLVWVGQSQIDAARLDLCPNLRPIVIEPGALGRGLPQRPLAVSPQHRILVKDGADEYLAAARHLEAAGMDGVRVVTDAAPFTLVHIACANHELILAEGVATETFFTGPMAVNALDADQRTRLFAAFPTLAYGENPMVPARPFLKKAAVAALLAQRDKAAA